MVEQCACCQWNTVTLSPDLKAIYIMHPTWTLSCFWCVDLSCHLPTNSERYALPLSNLPFHVFLGDEKNVPGPGPFHQECSIKETVEPYAFSACFCLSDIHRKCL
jgi:hypothetical protein